MIDSFQKLAKRMWWIKHIAVVGGVIFLGLLAAIIFSVDSRLDDQYLIPSILGLLWSWSLYVFISTFQVIPEKADGGGTFFRQVRQRIHRSWYWLIALIFAGTTVAALLLTLKLVSIWMADHTG